MLESLAKIAVPLVRKLGDAVGHVDLQVGLVSFTALKANTARRDIMLADGLGKFDVSIARPDAHVDGTYSAIVSLRRFVLADHVGDSAVDGGGHECLPLGIVRVGSLQMLDKLEVELLFNFLAVVPLEPELPGELPGALANVPLGELVDVLAVERRTNGCLGILAVQHSAISWRG
jgi:hypothetical protein